MDFYQTPINLAGGEERFVCPQSLVLNSYMGCQHNCVYCYARYVMDVYGHWKSVKPADPAIVEAVMQKSFDGKRNDAIAKLIRMRVPFRFSNLTDPFQEWEHTYKVTYNILKILAQYKYPIIINTKGIICAEDEYIEVLKKMPVVIQMTITTPNSELALKIEPDAPLPKHRLTALKKLSEAGIITQIRFSPVYPILADNPSELFGLAALAGARDVICEFVRLPLSSKYQNLLNERLGFDYIKFLQEHKYPIVKYRHWWKVQKPFIFDEYRRLKGIAEKAGLNFYVCCEEQPEINNFENCCGTCKYPGFENSMDWTVQMNGKKFGKTPISFNDYVAGTNCPYAENFKKFWDRGGLVGTMYRLTCEKGLYQIASS